MPWAWAVRSWASASPRICAGNRRWPRRGRATSCACMRTLDRVGIHWKSLEIIEKAGGKQLGRGPKADVSLDSGHLGACSVGPLRYRRGLGGAAAPEPVRLPRQGALGQRAARRLTSCPLRGDLDQLRSVDVACELHRGLRKWMWLGR